MQIMNIWLPLQCISESEGLFLNNIKVFPAKCTGGKTGPNRCGVCYSSRARKAFFARSVSGELTATSLFTSIRTEEEEEEEEKKNTDSMTNSNDESEADTSHSSKHHSDTCEGDMDTEEKVKTAASFCGLGIVLHCFFTLVISGSEDILSGTLLPTPTILVSHVAPMVLVTTAFPWCMQKISYSMRALSVFFFMTIGLVMLTFMDSIYLKIAGVSLNAIAHALGEISFLALTAFYGETAIAAFAAGSGVGILLGPIYYTAMTTWACVSPQSTLMIVLPSPMIVLVCYFCLNIDRVKPYAFLNEPGRGEYTLLDTADNGGLTWREKVTAALQITPLMLSLMVAYVTQYITVQAVFTTIAFSNAPFAPRNHFVYYVLMNGFGEFITRSYLNIVLFIKPSIVPNVIIKRTWLFAIPLLGIMGFAICASYFRFLNDVMVVMATCLVVGALSGAVFANTVCAVPLIVEPRYREFCLGLISAGESTGALLASLAGLKVEPALREHCQINFPEKTCFTRNDHHQWTRAVCS